MCLKGRHGMALVFLCLLWVVWVSAVLKFPGSVSVKTFFPAPLFPAKSRANGRWSSEVQKEELPSRSQGRDRCACEGRTQVGDL